MSGNGAGTPGAGVDESLGAFEAVSEPQAQSNPHSRSSGASFLGCIDYLSESLYVSVEYQGLALEYPNPCQRLNAPDAQKGDGSYFAFRARVI
jgi:hypothetical protein